MTVTNRKEADNKLQQKPGYPKVPVTPTSDSSPLPIILFLHLHSTCPSPCPSPSPQEYHNDPEKLADLYYDLAQSYASSPELRKTWLRNMLQLHVSQGNFSEVCHCPCSVTAVRDLI